MKFRTVSYNGRRVEHQGELIDMTVHVVAWASSGGDGFDWFYDKENAVAAYRGEIIKVTNLAEDNWTAYRFDVDTDQTDPEAITAEIDGQLIELCADATSKWASAMTPSSND